METARKTAAEAGQVFIPQVVQVESVWVYRTAFGLEKGEILRILHHLRNNSAFVLQRPEVYSAALQTYQSSRLDFADCVILQEAGLEGVQLCTFDKRFRHLDADVLPS